MYFYANPKVALPCQMKILDYRLLLKTVIQGKGVDG